MYNHIFYCKGKNVHKKQEEKAYVKYILLSSTITWLFF